MNEQQGKLNGVLRAASAFFERGYFAVFMLSALLFWNALMITLVMLPEAESGIGAFAQEFRQWCFGYDEATGTINWAYIIPFITVPLILGGATVAVYFGQLRSALRKPLALSICSGAALGVVALAGVGFYWMSEAMPPIAQIQGPGASPGFPAERLRTSYDPPEINLTNQNGENVRIEDFRGKVVIMTGIYSTCPHT